MMMMMLMMMLMMMMKHPAIRLHSEGGGGGVEREMRRGIQSIYLYSSFLFLQFRASAPTKNQEKVFL